MGADEPSELPGEELRGLLQETMEFAGIGLFRYAFDGTILFMDRNVFRILELDGVYASPREVTGKNIADVIRHVLPIGQIRNEVRRNRFVRGYEYPFITLKGQRKWLLNNSYLVHDQASGLEAVQVVLHDITERKQADEALQDALSRFEAVIENTPLVAIQGFDRDGVVRHWNRTSEQFYGYSAAEMIGQPITGRLLRDEAADQFERTLRTIWETGQPAEPREWSVESKNGDTRWIYSSMFPVAQQGAVAEVFCMDVDITASRRSAMDQRRLETQLQHTQRLESLGVLAGGVAHEFNNLLMGILGHAELALLTMDDAGHLESHLRQVVRSTERAAELTRQLLTYSGQGSFFFHPVDLSSLIKDVAHLCAVSQSKKVELRYELAQDLPLIDGDAAQLHQVVLNLVSNAGEAIGEENGEILIRTGVVECDRVFLAEARYAENSPEGRYVYLEVSDSGRGMDEETLARIFDPFFTTKFIGRGLGLAAAIGIVRAHQGFIHTESIPGKGSKFTILFPETHRREIPMRPVTQTHGKGLILLVDDEKEVRTVIREFLEQAGYEVLTAADGVEAVKIFEEAADEITLVLLDVKMPRMDGEEAFGIMRGIRPDIRVVLSSGYGEQDAMQRFKGKGITGFVQKPYHAKALLVRLQEILGGPEAP